jgi:hypothetical protein
MRDDAWWDGEDEGEPIAELQRMLAPLREPPAPWGDVLARARFTTLPQRPLVRPFAVAGAAAALAAAALLGWFVGRMSAPELLVPLHAPTTTTPVCDLPVAEPGPPPKVVHLALPIPVDVTDVPALVQQKKNHLELMKLLGDIDRNRTLKGLLKQPFEAGASHEDIATLLQDIERDPELMDKIRAGEKRPQAPPKEKELDVDCILDPTTEKCLDGGPRGERLPDTLTTKQIKAAMAKVKPRVKACAAEHHATPGERVKIKLSISGDTGRVTSVHAEVPHDDTALGRCIAEAVEGARFQRFRKPWLGVVYPFDM